ncbi:hypothetical protein TEQG_02617 [Trichophyton equinum CBS 127.97]|uniref:Uncharacterized protein n=1 Tax=Trichophyton equinum (strain ATCC MYA-4606 / CBS 127.97) TaxID=559882 RepID=F2PNW9_TRIEC|nr:hypothetical protein TEQG_02617 [Trichophyton equinum CBS 127.97]
MNRFRNRKKRGDGPEPSDAPPVPIFSKQFFKKKPEPEQPPKIDLSTALPTDNDFRTSLLMPNLSARFSMLREQDDPNSKIGKANDDSVLFPKRASRLNLFANSQLADITEVGSLHGSDRPSLNIGRSSYASGSTDDDCHTPSSIMTRSRPIEGNTLFGGRQKVYKIPNTRSEPASENEGGSEGGARSPTMGGKQLYQNDIGSIFQRSKDDDDSKSEPDLRPDSTTLMSLPSNRQAEPSSFFVSENRNSASTTSANSQGPTSRQGSVTAETSTRSTQNSAGTGLERNPTKSRRLYDRGLELQNQPSALSRLESISRQRTIASDNGLIKRSLSKSAVNLNERYQKLSPVYSSSSFRPTSPPPSSTSSVVGNSEPKRLSPVSTINSTQGLAMGSPLSPPASETEEGSAFAAAIQPEDRGKATATGLFNKPLSKYDESQFSQRQIQIHDNRSNASLQRPKDISITSHQSKPESPRLSTSQNSPLSTPHSIDFRPAPVQSEKPRLPINPSTFLADFSGSDSGSEAEEDVSNARVSPLFHPHESVGSPLRVSMESGDSITPVSSTKPSHPAPGEFYSESRDLNTIKEDEPVADPVPTVQEPPQQTESESPVLGPTGLSGLIRAHLRQDSDKSTIYPPSSPISMDRPPENSHPSNPQVHGTRSSDLAVSIHSNPWEYDDWARPTYHPAEPAERFTCLCVQSKCSAKQPLLAIRAARRKHTNTENQEERAPATSVPTAPKPSPTASQPSWEEDIKFGHRRGGSTETQMEREEFANELAERRRKVQEKLRNFAANESRSTSPASSYRFPDNGNGTQTPSKTGNAFAILKAKTSRNQNNQSKQDHPLSKSSKLLGLDKPHFNSSAPNLQQGNDMWREEDERMRRLVRKARAESPMGGNRQIAWGRQPQPPQSTTPQSRRSEEDTRNSTRDSASSTWRSGPRDRSDSDASGRSKSRPRYREDLGAVRESAEQPRMGRPSIEDKASRSSSSRPSTESTDRRTRDRSASTGRYRSNSRSVPPNYIDLQSLPGPSPTLQHPAMAHSSRPSPSPNSHPYSANATPPILETSSASSAPAAGGYGGPPMQYPLPQRNPPVPGSVATQQSLGSHKRVVDKSQISEPTFVSTTSNVPTVGLPAGASLANGAPTPPIPPMNPRRRRQTTTHNILGAFKGSSPSDRSDQYHHHSPKHHNQNRPNSSRRSEEHSTFSDDEKRPRARQRLRKISSEGGNLNAKARHHLMNGNQPALPPPPRHNRVEGLL